jgi:hypothetical protein
MASTRDCQQCGTMFVLRRDHAALPRPLPGRMGTASMLGVVDNRDFEQGVRDLVAEQLPGEEREIGDVADDGLGDAAARVADDRSVAELESEDDRRVDPVVEAGDGEDLRRGRAKRDGGVSGAELLVAFEQGGGSSWSWWFRSFQGRYLL